MSEILTIPLDSKNRAIIEKDPEAFLDYTWDWDDYLVPDLDTIVNSNPNGVTQVTGEDCTILNFTHDGRYVTAWISGGTPGIRAKAICQIATQQGRVDQRTIYLKIKER